MSSSFGTKCERFNNHGIHPKRLKHNSSSNLGPGSYDANWKGSFQISNKNGNVYKSNWKRQYFLERESAIPSLLCREQRADRESNIRSLGPGKYNINLDHSSRKSFTDRGPINTLTKRFNEPNNTNCTPGVGTYGLGGDPYAYKEAMEAIKKSASTIGLLSSKTGAYRGLPESSGHIGPGTYETGQFLETFLNKVTSLRGPYDLTTGPRSKPILSEYPEPGAYKVQSFMDIWASPDKKHFGKFQRIHGTVSLKKTKQIINDSKQPTVVHEVSPATYDPSLPNKKAQSSNCQNVPFLSQASRYDGSLFAVPKIPVGPGRYDIERFDDARCVWGAMCSFDSQTTARMDSKECTKWSERLRPTNIPPSRRFKIDHVSTVKEPSIVLPTNGLYPRSIPLIA